MNHQHVVSVLEGVNALLENAVQVLIRRYRLRLLSLPKIFLWDLRFRR